MRVAIQFFGHLRTFYRCWPVLRRNLLSQCDCDIFMHTWDVMNHCDSTWHNHHSGCRHKVNVEKLCRRLGIPKDQLIVESQHVPDMGGVFSSGRCISIGGLNAMWHSMRAVNKLRVDFARRNNVDYDYVVFIRPDIFLSRRLNISEIVQSAGGSAGRIFSLGAAPLLIDCLEQVRATDVLFFARPDEMNRLMNALPPDLNDGQQFGDNGPEILFNRKIAQLKMSQVWVSGFVYNRDFWILRPIKWNFKRLIRLHTYRNGIDVILFDFLPFGFSCCGALSHEFFINLQLGIAGNQGKQ